MLRADEEYVVRHERPFSVRRGLRKPKDLDRICAVLRFKDYGFRSQRLTQVKEPVHLFFTINRNAEKGVSSPMIMNRPFRARFDRGATQGVAP